ncbi:MAG: dephospho-CoA kinase [Phycisphaerae bacterium]|nr:dephospho-CoA kinase [Phycisphaerae bacterium]
MNHAHEQTRPADRAATRQPVVLGIAGGIGSGKSTVAREFARMGWVVIDSDSEAKAALMLPDVKKTLVEWWGPAVLHPNNEINRTKVGEIVFADELQRKRLESLIHPLIAKSRREAISAATARLGRVPPGVIYDAPLLFEAGLDQECDAIVFVEAPEPIRLERARRGRGWDEVEYRRRQAAQWPLERKKARCRFVIQNERDGVDLAEPCRQIAAILLGGQE